MVNIIYSDNSPVPDPNKKETNLSYHVDRKMINFLNKVKNKITYKDKDYVLLIDGYEGSGKSTFAQQIGKYVDPTLDLKRICMTAEEFKQEIIKADKGQCVIYDEAVTGMTSGDSITRVGKLLKSMMMQMRQKNLFVIVILPSIFELNKYAVLSRARSFFHVYESNGRMGYFVGYNRKDTKRLYIKGRKSYSYKIRSFFNGRFYGKYVVNELEYRKKKAEALFSLEDEDNKPSESSVMAIQRNRMIAQKQKELKSCYKVSDYLKEMGITISPSQVSRIVKEITGKTRGLMQIDS